MNDFLSFFEIKIPGYVFIASFVLMSMVVGFTIIFRCHSKAKYFTLLSLLAEYYFLTLCSTVIYRNAIVMARSQLMPFWNYAEICSGKDPKDFWEVLLNIALFVPIGMLVTCMSSRVKWCHVAFVGVILSSIIEVLQYLLHRGLCETDDVIHNALGCVLGYLIFKVIMVFFGNVTNQ